jgi:hypothetical protein
MRRSFDLFADRQRPAWALRSIARSKLRHLDRHGGERGGVRPKSSTLITSLELGRLAVTYRATFAENPSVTPQRNRKRKSAEAA